MSFYITDYKMSAAPGKSVALEDCVMHRGRPVTAGSKILGGFISPIDATVVVRLEAAGYVVSGKTKMDEFGVGALFSDENEGKTQGAIEAVLSGSARFALCNDISGEIRKRAPLAGLCYIHPTYGTVSRYGLIPAACSMDQIGILCADPAEGFKLLSAIAGKDSGDGAMFPEENYCYRASGEKITLGVPKGFSTPALSEFADRFGCKAIKLEYSGIYRQVLQILAAAEISGNLSRYDGVKFGYRAENVTSVEDMYHRSRTEGFGEDIKLVAVLGSMLLSKEYYGLYYEKAMKMRRIIRDSLDFCGYDAVILPSNAEPGALSALAGLPSLSIPYKGEAIHLLAKVKGENALLSVWEAVK